MATELSSAFVFLTLFSLSFLVLGYGFGPDSGLHKASVLFPVTDENLLSFGYNMAKNMVHYSGLYESVSCFY